MSDLASWLARKIWWLVLWIMRRPAMKRLQRASLGMFGEARRERARRSLIGQNRWARRYGLTLIGLSLNLFFASCAVTLSYVGAVALYNSGALTPPQLEARQLP